jgi:hypothetical protein
MTAKRVPRMAIQVTCPGCRGRLLGPVKWVHHVMIKCVLCDFVFTLFAKDGYLARLI